MKAYVYISIGVGAVLILLLAAWLLFHNSPVTTNNQVPVSTYSSVVDSTNTASGSPLGSFGATNQPVSSGIGQQGTNQKVFEIASGPIAGATFVQTFNPTTTIARYVMQDSGHVFDLPIDVPGAMAQSVSDTTVPGIANAVWVEDGGGVILQYDQEGVIKTVYTGFSTSTSPTPRINFYPDDIVGIAASRTAKVSRTCSTPRVVLMGISRMQMELKAQNCFLCPSHKWSFPGRRRTRFWSLRKRRWESRESVFQYRLNQASVCRLYMRMG